MTQDALVNKRDSLDELDKSEHEARRLEEALGRGRPDVSPGQPNQQQVASTPSSPEIVGEEENGEHDVEREQASSWPALPPHPGPSPTRRRSRTPGMGLLNALSYTLHGMMDVDPETARRNTITKTRENISQVNDEDCMPASILKV